MTRQPTLAYLGLVGRVSGRPPRRGGPTRLAEAPHVGGQRPVVLFRDHAVPGAGWAAPRRIEELFTTADNDRIARSQEANGSPRRAALLLAAGLAIDIAFTER